MPRLAALEFGAGFGGDNTTPGRSGPTRIP